MSAQGTQKLKLGRSPFSGGKADKGGGTRATGTSFLRSARKDPNTVRRPRLFSITLSGSTARVHLVVVCWQVCLPRIPEAMQHML